MANRLVNGKLVPLTPEEEAQIKAEWEQNAIKAAANEYKAKRIAEYPTVQEQLEMLWKEMDTNPAFPRATEFYNTIKAVRDRHPKPQG
jgi:hypothetical protein